MRLARKIGALVAASSLGMTLERDSELEMANTKALAKDERKKAKRAARKKRTTENPLKKRTHARGSAKRKVKKLARGQSKR